MLNKFRTLIKSFIYPYLIRKHSRINCIGDSHSSFFIGIIPQKTPAGKWLKSASFAACRIGPFLAYNLKEKIRKIEVATSQIPSGSNLMFCFGEIDCRAHLKEQAERQQRDLNEIISECVRRYFDVILYFKDKGYRMFVWNVIPPLEKIDSEEYPSYGSIVERSFITEKFNSCMQELCSQDGVTFVSIYRHLLSSGKADPAYYNDNVHLNSEAAMPLVVNEFKRVGVLT